MGKKNILVISTEYPPAPGGIGSHAFYLVKELSRLGWNFAVATEQNYTSNSRIEEFNRTSPYSVYRLLPTPSMVLLLRKALWLMWLCIKHRTDIVIGTGKHGSWFAYLVARLTLRKCVLIGHGTEFSVTMSARSKKINTHVFSNCDELICVSDYTRQVALKEGIKNKNTTVIFNGADADNFKVIDAPGIEKFKAEHNLSGKKIIVTVGKVTDRKGQEWVIRAMPEILAAVPNAHYYCIGLPDIKAKLEKVAADLNVSNHVHFSGAATTGEVLMWLNCADIFAMTSTYVEGDFEGFGIAVIEAALCGKPAVVSNQSGLAEAIIEGKTGLGAPEKNTALIAQKIILLLNNEGMLKQMGANALENASKNLTWTEIAKSYDKEFKKMLDIN